MNISGLRVRIIIQKNETVVDKYGNHKSAWADYFSCWATATMSGKSAQETANAGYTQEADRLDVTVRWSSETAAVNEKQYRVFRGIFKKVLIFVMVGIGHILDVQVLGSVGVLRTAVIFFYLSNEGVSLMENAAYLGLPIPAKLKAVLEQLHDRAEKEDK